MALYYRRVRRLGFQAAPVLLTLLEKRLAYLEWLSHWHQRDMCDESPTNPFMTFTFLEVGKALMENEDDDLTKSREI